jgi:phage anti-repressor protein
MSSTTAQPSNIFDIVELIEKNPITRLTNTYQCKLITKIKEKFNDNEQHLFVASFYCFLHCNPTDFVIDLDNVWEWLGFSQKAMAKRTMEKHFKPEIDYKSLLCQSAEQKKEGRGGHNKEKIMLTINAFKRFCLKAGTTKADQIHEYYLKMEETLQEVINEESNELKLQLEEQKKTVVETKEQLEEQKKKSQLEKEILREKTLLEQFPDNVQCVYYGAIDDVSSLNERLIKFGNSNFLQNRVEAHKKTFTNFRLLNVFKVSNQILIENLIKQHPILKKKRRNVVLDEKNNTELIAINDFTFNQIDEMIKKIIDENQYNIENYNKLLEENSELKLQVKKLTEANEKLTEKNKKLGESQNIYKDTGNIHNNLPDRGMILYVFECKDNTTDKYKCGICRNDNYDKTIEFNKSLYTNGEVVHTVRVYNVFTEKMMMYLLKSRLLHLGKEIYNGSLDDIKLIYDIIVKNEEKLMERNVSLQYILDFFSNKAVEREHQEYIEPDVPRQRKSARSIDQVNPTTGQVIATYKSIEEAGRENGITGSAVGIALRNHSLSKGFIWRYTGISPDDQMKNQPVIKYCCKTGEKTYFTDIASAARDCKISAPGLRNRILTKVHINDHHWVFNKEAGSTHYE